MLQVNINNSRTIEVSKEGKDLLLDGTSSDYELIKRTDASFTIIKATKIYHVEILSLDGRKASISINNKAHKVEISSHMDQILEELGMNASSANQVKEIKAPMPGSILSVNVKENDTVQAGDPILVLEAMKMENVIKSPGDGVVNKIHISEKENVEKNQVLITFD